MQAPEVGREIRGAGGGGDAAVPRGAGAALSSLRSLRQLSVRLVSPGTDLFVADSRVRTQHAGSPRSFLPTWLCLRSLTHTELL